MVKQVLWSFVLALASCLAASATTRNVCDYGATPDGGGYDSAGFQAAATACKKGDVLVVPTGEYRLDRPVDWTFPFRVDVKMEPCVQIGFNGVGDGMRQAAITWGGKPGVRFNYGRWTGGVLFKGGPSVKAWDTPDVGLVLQNTAMAHVDFEAISVFHTGLVLRADGAPVAYSEIHGSISGCKVGITVEHLNGGWSNRITFAGGHLSPGKLTGVAPYDSATLLLIPKGIVYAQGWTFRDWSFETGESPVKLLDWPGASYLTFDDCWFEVSGGKPKMACVGSAQYFGTVRVRGGVQAGVDWPNQYKEHGWIVTEP